MKNSIPKTEKTLVIFRTWRKTRCDEGGGTIALFPEVPEDVIGRYCVSYMHTGQHGGADPQLIKDTRPATYAEKEPLRKELEGIGYALEERFKISYRMDRARMEAARRNPDK